VVRTLLLGQSLRTLGALKQVKGFGRADGKGSQV
jgi:hypothetical protein